ncbi:MAG: hypothetical protein ACRD8Z_12150, partial [Nitrososphaeraceae archaeon]
LQDSTEGSNYIWTRMEKIIHANLRANTNYQFIINTSPEDQNEHQLIITTMQGEEIAEDEGLDEGES